MRPGDLVLDAGAGFGRHAFELARLGANVVALDYSADEVVTTRGTFGAMVEAGEIPEARYVGALQGDATRLPFDDGSFDRVITSEVLEHIQDDVAAIGELVRVLRPGGTFACTVPTWYPEKINWLLSDEYHAPKSVGGHVRIYSATELKAKLRTAGLHGHRQPPRPRAALAVLVVEVRRRAAQRRPPAVVTYRQHARVGDHRAARLDEGASSACSRR